MHAIYGRIRQQCIHDVFMKVGWRSRANMSAMKSIQRQAKEALGIEIGRGKRVPPERQDSFDAKVEELMKVTVRWCVWERACSVYTDVFAQETTPKQKRDRESKEDGNSEVNSYELRSLLQQVSNNGLCIAGRR